MNWTVAHGDYVKLKLFNKIRQFQAKRKLRRVFDADFGQQDSCAQCFGQVLASYQKTPSSSISKGAQSVSTQISSNRTIAHSLLASFSLLTKVAKFRKNDSCAEYFDANFEQQNSCAQSLWQVLASYHKTPSSSKSTVAQSVLTPTSSIRTVAHGLLDKFKLFNKSGQMQEKRQLRTVFWRLFRATGQLRTVF